MTTFRMEGNQFLQRGSQPPTNADITLSILSSHNNLTNQFRYIDAIPTSLGDIVFESTATGTEYISFNATFRFSYFEMMTVNGTTGAITDTFDVSGSVG